MIYVSIIHCGKREGVSSAISGTVDVPSVLFYCLQQDVLWSECITLGMCLHLGMGVISFHK